MNLDHSASTNPSQSAGRGAMTTPNLRPTPRTNSIEILQPSQVTPGPASTRREPRSFNSRHCAWTTAQGPWNTGLGAWTTGRIQKSSPLPVGLEAQKNFKFCDGNSKCVRLIKCKRWFWRLRRCRCTDQFRKNCHEKDDNHYISHRHCPRALKSICSTQGNSNKTKNAS